MSGSATLKHEKKKPSNNGTKVLFKSKFLEGLTRTHIAAPLIVFSIYSGTLIYLGLTEKGLNTLEVIGLFFSGMLLFSLVEYVMHRYLFHLAPTTPAREKFVYSVHGVHHDFPKDKDRLAMPLIFSIPLATLFLGFYYLIMGNMAFAFTPGFLMGYSSYLWVHYMVHAFRVPNNIFKILWVHHGIHHYKEPERAFGVSSPLWDLIFRTMPKTKGSKLGMKDI